MLSLELKTPSRIKKIYTAIITSRDRRLFLIATVRPSSVHYINRSPSPSPVGNGSEIRLPAAGERANEVDLMAEDEHTKVENEAFENLKAIFDNLPDNAVKECFIYCSLYPEGLPIPKEKIIDYCVGEGIIEDYDEKGHELLRRLQAAELLEEADGEEENVKMKPVIRGFGLWIAGETTKLSLDSKPQQWRLAERASLMENGVHELREVPECPNLKSLLLLGNKKLHRIGDGFFASMVKLQVLDLSCTAISELPEGIEELAELRHLDLSGTEVENLPKGVGKLKKLKLLLLSNMKKLKNVPDGVIAGLSNVQILRMDDSYGNWKIGDMAGNGVDFDELGELSVGPLKELGLTIEALAVLRRLVNSPELSQRVKKLQIHGCEGLSDFDLPSRFLRETMESIQNLWIRNSNEIEEVNIIDDNNSGGSNSKLQKLILERIDRAKIYWKGGSVKNLTYLKIWKCKRMEHLIYCDDHEFRNGEESESESFVDAFPNLKRLDLVHLPEMKSLSNRRSAAVRFPALETLMVSECPKLKKIAMAAAEKLKEVRGARDWWEQVEWAAGVEKSKLDAYFQDIFE